MAVRPLPVALGAAAVAAAVPAASCSPCLETETGVCPLLVALGAAAVTAAVPAASCSPCFEIETGLRPLPVALGANATRGTAWKSSSKTSLVDQTYQSIVP